MGESMGDADATRSAPPEVAPSGRATASTLAPIEPGTTFVDDPESYAIAGAIGAGGMGQVLAATGSRLGRAVALKVITADREDLRRRFEREAQVTARLQHPNIVPVYGSGRRDGQPFYAMKQVTGDPLDKVIAGAPTLAKRIALLPNVIAVTEAIAYAHAERVIHRDLKPANVLVGKFGETVVIDWGLAKDLARADDDPEASVAESVTPFRERTGGAADATAAGRVMGTPAYMPLEQARGEVVDQRADVYALGAMLYHVLAGKAPYLRDDDGALPWETMLARVLAGPPAPLAERAPDAPPDLVAIVDRAMARKASDRYASAGELAEDLRRFEMGQLVGAHRYSTWQLVRRWLRRHRAPVTVGAALLVVLAVVSILSVQRIRRERSDAEDARATAEEQRGLATASRNDAEDLIGFMLGDLKDKLKPVGKLDILDPVVAKTIAYYDKRPDSDDDVERAKHAQALMNVGEVRAAEGSLPAALDAYRKALGLREPLAAPATAFAAQGELAFSHLKIGDVLYLQNAGSAALVEYKAGLAIADKAAAGAPTNDDIALVVADAHDDIGDLERDRGDVEPALVEYRAALATREAAVTRTPVAALQHKLVVSKANIAYALFRKGDLDGALAQDREMLALAEKIAADNPKDTQLRRDAGTAHTRVGEVLVAQRKLKDALAEYQTARTTAESLSAIDPTNTERLRDLEVVYSGMARLYAAGGDGSDALVEDRQALATSETLSKLDPANGQWRRDLALMHQTLAAHMRGKDLDGALAELAITRDIEEKLAAGDPDNQLYQMDLAAVHNITGNALSAVDTEARVRQSLPEFEAAAVIFKRLSDKSPDSMELLRKYVVTRGNLADNLAELDDPKAKDIYNENLNIYDRILLAVPSDNDLRSSQIVAHFNLGNLAIKTDLAGACAEFQKSEDIAKQLLAIDATNKEWTGYEQQARDMLDKRCKPAK